MNYYDFEEIRQRADCLQYATQVLGLAPVNGRDLFNHPTRPGADSGSFRISTAGWYCHVTEEKGGVLDLVALVRGCDLQTAQDEVGTYLNLKPKKKSKAYRKPSGWGEVVATYHYGERIQKLRYEKGGEKTFRWRHQTADGSWASGRSGEKRLYMQDELAAWAWVLIVEGEKDVDSALINGLQAVSSPDGAGSWEDSYDSLFAGKVVGIVPDGDDVGRGHGDDIARRLKGRARVHVIDTPDGMDLTKMLDAGVDIIALLKNTPEFTPNDDPVALAKKANLTSLMNYTGDKNPVCVLDIVADVRTRCLKFPRRIGDILFDHERTEKDSNENTGRIRFLPKTSSLVAWIGEKTGHPVRWARQGEGMVNQEQLYESLLANTERYEGIYSTPTFPRRDDVYYTHGPLPAPSGKFEGLVNFFRPATEEDRILLRVLLAAPMFFRPGIDRPLWIIDSTTGPRSGKSTLAHLLSYLHGNTIGGQQPIMVQPEALRNNGEEITKRVISAGGREKKILLIDNVTGRFTCPELAAMITAPAISGRAPYGRGEETRPNDLTYMITANTAQIDTDLATRAFWVILEKPSDDAGWKGAVMDYIDEHRMDILSELCQILKAGPQFELEMSLMTTRFPKFEYDVLVTIAGTMENYSKAIKYIIERGQDANLETEEASRLGEIIRERLQCKPLMLDAGNQCIFIRSRVIEEWVHEGWQDLRGNIVQKIRNYAKTGQLPEIDPEFTRYPYNSNRKGGVMWVGDDPAGIPLDEQQRPNPSWVINMLEGAPHKSEVGL